MGQAPANRTEDNQAESGYSAIKYTIRHLTHRFFLKKGAYF